MTTATQNTAIQMAANAQKVNEATMPLIANNGGNAPSFVVSLIGEQFPVIDQQTATEIAGVTASIGDAVALASTVSRSEIAMHAIDDGDSDNFLVDDAFPKAQTPQQRVYQAAMNIMHRIENSSVAEVITGLGQRLTPLYGAGGSVSLYDLIAEGRLVKPEEAFELFFGLKPMPIEVC